MRYYLRKEDIQDGIVCNIIEDETYDTRLSENGFIIKHNFKEKIKKDVVLTKKRNFMILKYLPYPYTYTVLRQSWDSWIDMMTNAKRLYIPLDFYESKVTIRTKGLYESIIPYQYHRWNIWKYGKNVSCKVVPKIFFKLIKLEAMPMKTQELKELLNIKNKRLYFKFDDLEVIVMPRRNTGFVENPKGTWTKDYESSNDIYINNIYERRVLDLNWNTIFHNKVGVQDDWRYLLGLDLLSTYTPKDLLHNYFVKAVDTSEEDITFTLDDKEIEARTLFEAEELKLRAAAPEGQPFLVKKNKLKENGLYAVSSTEPTIKQYSRHYIKKNPANKVILSKEERYKRYSPTVANRQVIVDETVPCINTNIGTTYTPMLDKTVEKIKRLNYLKESNQEIRNISNSHKKSKRIDNHYGHVCVKDIKAKNIFRTYKTIAIDLMKNNKDLYEYANKEEWRKFKKDKLAGIWKDGLVVKDGKTSRYTGINRKDRRKYDTRPGHSVGSGDKALRLTIIKKTIPAHETTIETTRFIPLWETIVLTFKKAVGWSAYDDRIRRKRIYHQDRKGKWHRRYVYDKVTELIVTTVPEKYTYKAVYSMGNTKSRKQGTYSQEAQVGIVRKPMKVKEKKDYTSHNNLKQIRNDSYLESITKWNVARKIVQSLKGTVNLETT